MLIYEGQWYRVLNYEGQWYRVLICEGQWYRVLIYEGQWYIMLNCAPRVDCDLSFQMEKVDAELRAKTEDCEKRKGASEDKRHNLQGKQEQVMKLHTSGEHIYIKLTHRWSEHSLENSM